MGMRVLVAYASKYGSTAEIADRIGQVLHEAGLTVNVVQVDQVADLLDYEAVVLGSAVYAGQWREGAVTFLEAQKQVLGHLPVWLFSSGPTGEGDPVQLMKGWRFPEAQRATAERIQPRDIAFFHGRLDVDHLNFGERLIVKGLKAQLGDFRDWGTIDAWAATIANFLWACDETHLTTAFR